MEAVQSEYKCRKMHKLDNQRVYNLLAPHVDNKNLMKEIKDHIRHGQCFKLQKDGVVVGAFLAMKYDSHYSLSYFYLKEDVRKKPITLTFFIHCAKSLNPLIPMYVMKNKNYETYSRYFETTKEENILIYKGLRDSSKDDNLIKRVSEWVVL